MSKTYYKEYYGTASTGYGCGSFPTAPSSRSNATGGVVIIRVN